MHNFSEIFAKFLIYYKKNDFLDFLDDFIRWATIYLNRTYPANEMVVFKYELRPFPYINLFDDKKSQEIKDLLLQDENDLQLNNIFIYPIKNFEEKICYIFINKENNIRNNKEVSDFLNITHSLFQILFEAMKFTKQTESEKNANIISQFSHDISSILSLIKREKITSKELSQKLIYSDQLLSNLLQYMREPEIMKVKTNASQLISATIENIQIPENIKLTTNIEDSECEISVDVDLISRVITEILKNAFQVASLEGGKVCISLLNVKKKDIFSDLNWINIEVSNSGPQIPDEFIDKVKEPFFTTFKSNSNSGLGLSIANRIVQAHNGLLEIKKADGQSTIVNIYLLKN